MDLVIDINYTANTCGHAALYCFTYVVTNHDDVAATNSINAAVTKFKPGTNSRWESNILCKMFESMSLIVQEPHHLKSVL